MAKEKSVRILVADDNEINQRVMQGMLEHRGVRVDVVRNGHEVLSKLASKSYDLVVMDCLMPSMDGFEATRAIRTSASAEINSEIPILAITALATPGDQEKCLETGMNDYISKPVVAEVLYDKLNKLLHKPGQAPASPDHQLPAGQVQPLPDFASGLASRLLSDLADWRKELQHLSGLDSLPELGRLAHRIRGSADVFGAAELSLAAGRVEMAARADRQNSTEELRFALLESVDRLLRRLQEQA